MLITDTELDKEEISNAVSSIGVSGKHKWSVHSQAEADDRAQTVFARHANLLSFRLGQEVDARLTEASPITGGLVFQLMPGPNGASTG